MPWLGCGSTALRCTHKAVGLTKNLLYEVIAKRKALDPSHPLVSCIFSALPSYWVADVSVLLRHSAGKWLCHFLPQRMPLANVLGE